MFIICNAGGTFKLKGVSIRAVKTEHEGLADALGYVIEGAGVTVYHVGDCKATDEIKQQAQLIKPNFLVVPINGKSI